MTLTRSLAESAPTHVGLVSEADSTESLSLIAGVSALPCWSIID